MNKDRLAKISLRFTPKQAALLCLKECQSYDSVTDYLSQLSSLPRDAWPERKIYEQIRESIAQEPTLDPDQVEPAVSQAQLEVRFLNLLRHGANEMVMSVLDQYKLLLMLFRGEIRGLIHMDHSPISNPANLTEEAIRLKIIISTLLSEIYSTEEASKFLSKKYFDGEAILFRDAERLLKSKIETLEWAASYYNDVIEVCRTDSSVIDELLDTGTTIFKSGMKIDLEEIRTTISAIILRKTSNVIEEAKMQALMWAGQRDEVKAIWDKRIAKMKKEQQERERDQEQM